MYLKIPNGNEIEINSTVYAKDKILDIGDGITLKPVGYIPKSKKVNLVNVIDSRYVYNRITHQELVGKKYDDVYKQAKEKGCSLIDFVEVITGPPSMRGKFVMLGGSGDALVLYGVNIVK